VKVITRVVDYGGLFWDDVTPDTELPEGDHRAFRPEGWIAEGRAKLDRIRPVAERAGLTPMQLACQWNLAHAPVQCVVPTLIQEAGGRPVEEQRADLAALPDVRLSDAEVAALRAIGDNTGSMTLKGAAPDFEGEPRPDRWALTPQLAELAARWGIEPARDLQAA
jgi:aryl-alcohol dehydrogenase-like predicted oxidoreductase